MSTEQLCMSALAYGAQRCVCERTDGTQCRARTRVEVDDLGPVCAFHQRVLAKGAKS